MFHKIMVPLDGSKRAEQAIPVAAAIARASGSSIVLLRVVTTPITYGWYALESSLRLDDVLETDMNSAKQYLSELAQAEILKGISTAVEALNGEPAEAILEEATSGRADLIVMCSHGDTGFKRWMLGSVSQKIAFHSTTPVLMLHEHAGTLSTQHPAGTQPVRVLVALDGSPLAEEALLPAAYLSAALSAPQAGALHLVQVLRFHEIEVYSENKAIVDIRKRVIAEAKDYLASITQRLQQEEIAKPQLAITSSVLLSRDVANSLIAVAEEGEEEKKDEGFNGSDVIALATHGRGGIQRWALGSVAERILSATKMPTLVIRPHKIASQQEKDDSHTTKQSKTTGTKGEAQSWVGLL